MPERRIALVIAGGVSLGSFEAGALSELLWALETVNRQAGERRFVLDVITGASAGGITAALVARTMLYDLDGRRRNLFRAWVEQSDLLRFLQDAPPNAVLSKREIERMAEELLADAPFEPTAPASFAPRGAERLELAFSLSSMPGMDYSIDYFPPQEGGFVSTFFSDRAHFTLEPEALPGRDGWREIARAAIASGNFPLAFRPEAVERTRADYPGADDTPLLPGALSFEDGGIFDNEPLGAALRLAREIDGGLVSPDRIILFVDPTLNRSSQEAVSPDGPSMEHALRLVTMIFGESRARDWLRVGRVNNELDWRNKLVAVLAKLCRETEPDPGSELLGQLEAASDHVVTTKKELFPGRYPENYLERCLEQVQRRFSEDWKGLGEQPGGEGRQKLFEHLVFLLNQISSLQSKEQIHPILIGSTPEQTAGDQLAGFAGFFLRDWREHDFRQGRIEARRVLSETGALGAEYPEEPDVPDYTIPSEWEGFPSVTLADAPRDVRRKLSDRITDRVMEALEERIPFLLRLPARWFVVEPAVEDLLEL